MFLDLCVEAVRDGVIAVRAPCLTARFQASLTAWGRLALEMGQVMRWVAGGLSSCFRKIEKALDTVNRCCALPRWLGPNYSGDIQLEENYPSGGKLEQL